MQLQTSNSTPDCWQGVPTDRALFGIPCVHGHHPGATSITNHRCHAISRSAHCGQPDVTQKPPITGGFFFFFPSNDATEW